MSSLSTLEKVLQLSVKKHGPDKPVTLGHLHNLVIKTIQEEEKAFLDDQKNHNEAFLAAFGSHGQG